MLHPNPEKMPRSTRSSSTSTSAKKVGVEEKEIKTWGSGGLFASRDLGALLLLVLCPLFGMLVWYIVVEQNGSLRDFYKTVLHKLWYGMVEISQKRVMG